MSRKPAQLNEVMETRHRSQGIKGNRVLILKDELNREFFRWENGRLTEYDVTKYLGKPLLLTEEELKASLEFESSIKDI